MVILNFNKKVFILQLLQIKSADFHPCSLRHAFLLYASLTSANAQFMAQESRDFGVSSVERSGSGAL